MNSGASFIRPGPIILLFVALLLTPSFSYGERSDGNIDRRELMELEAHYRESVMRGWRDFQTSYADDGMACANCHLSHEQMTGWTGSYPKVQMFDGTPYRVTSLRGTVLEALTRHTDLSATDRENKADDMVAYISWWGDGQRITPGISRTQAPAPDDLLELEDSVKRGRALFMRKSPPSCSQCHSPAADSSTDGKLNLYDTATRFPKYDLDSRRVLSMGSFLSKHHKTKNLFMDSPEITDIQAYLADLASGKILQPGGGVNESK